MLKVIKYTNANAIEATWYDIVITPAVVVEGEEGYQPEQRVEIALRSIAYADIQMQLFRDDVDKYGGDITEWESLIAEVEANIQPALAPVYTVEDIRVALQAAIDERAKSYGFSGGNALMLYAGFTNYFQPLAQAFATWEASVWVEAEAYKADVLAGLKPMLTPNEAVALMPAYLT